MSQRPGRPVRRSTTPSARGASPITRCSCGVAPIELLVFVANGDSDPMILPRYSYLLAGLLPDARVTLFPDSAHGFLFQHHSQFAADVHAFLEEAD
jgi:pimeloyl-ACP methyl ester carboxylesterase